MPDGRILLAGGAGPEGAVASAEIFDDTAAFVAAASMNVARTQYASVVLHDGRVLVSGGLTETGEPTNTAEVYDAASNTWTLVGTMSHARYGHTASRLSEKQDGRVVIAGGDDTADAPGSIELFDPAFNSFIPAGNLSSDRRDHSAAVLADDRVLFAGGSAGEAALATLDVFDSAVGSVSEGPALSSARTDASATVLLDGKVLIAGGRNESGYLGSAELYNPVTNTLASAESNLLVPRSGHSAVKLPHNNNVLFIGGSSGGTALDSCELYVPWLDQFKPASQLIDARVQASGTPLNVTGLLLVSGGRGVATAEVYGFATIRTDKDDYAPYTWVEITGAGFGPGETVVNEVEQIVGPDAGDIYDAWEIPANENGGFFTSWLVFSDDLLNTTLQLTSTGTSTGLSARTTFTDGNVKAMSNSSEVTFELGWSTYANSGNCGGPVDKSGTDKTVGTKNRFSRGVAAADSITLTAAALSDKGGAFINWTGPNGFLSTSFTICVPGNFTGTRTYIANYSTTGLTITAPPSVTVLCASSVPTTATTSAEFTAQGGTISNACPGPLTVEAELEISEQTSPNNYTITRVYTITDSCKKEALSQQTITVNDTEAPVITCPATVTVSTDAGKCEASGVVLGTATASDNCSAASAIRITKMLPRSLPRV
jgi:hypothetical protein